MYLFISWSSSTIKQFAKFFEAVERKVFKTKNTLLFLVYPCMFWPNVTENHQFCIPWVIKEKGFFWEKKASFHLLKIYKHITTQNNMSTQNPPATEITEPIIFTVWKLGLRGKAIRSQPWFKGAHILYLICWYSTLGKTWKGKWCAWLCNRT